jgi:hypothetical protein
VRVAAVLGNHGAMFGALDRFAEALAAASQQVIDRCGEDPGPARRDLAGQPHLAPPQPERGQPPPR